MGKLKIGAIVIGVIFLLAIVIGVIGAYMEGELEEPPLTETQEEAIERAKMERELLDQGKEIPSRTSEAKLQREFEKMTYLEQYNALIKNSEYNEAEKILVKYVQEYKGNDNSGNTMVEALGILINVAYSDQDILNHPATTVSMYVLGDDPYWSFEKKDQFEIVVFNLETYKEEVEYNFIVDITSGEIFGSDQTAENLLKALDVFE